MSLASYSDLQTSIANFSHRTDLTSIIPDLITLAETRINGDLDARAQDTKSALATVASVESVAAPTDLINIRNLSISSTTPIVTLVYQAPDTYEIDHPWGVTGTPTKYTVIGANLYLAPTPDAVYTLDIVYKARVPSLSVTNTTNYLLTTYPMVYLAAAMCQVATYTRDAGMSAQWEQQYTDSIKSVNTQDWFSGSTMRIKSDTRL